MTINGGIIVGALVAPMLLGLFLLRRDVDRLMLDLASLVAWRDSNFGPEPAVMVDEPLPTTEPMPRVDIAGGVRAAREANRERPVPFPRGKHRAG